MQSNELVSSTLCSYHHTRDRSRVYTRGTRYSKSSASVMRYRASALQQREKEELKDVEEKEDRG